jgi:hypothetical protein
MRSWMQRLDPDANARYLKRLAGELFAGKLHCEVSRT